MGLEAAAPGGVARPVKRSAAATAAVNLISIQSKDTGEDPVVSNERFLLPNRFRKSVFIHKIIIMEMRRSADLFLSFLESENQTAL